MHSARGEHITNKSNNKYYKTTPLDVLLPCLPQVFRDVPRAVTEYQTVIREKPEIQIVSREVAATICMC